VPKSKIWLRLCPRPLWGAYSAPQTSQLDLRGLLLRGGDGSGGRGRDRRGGECCGVLKIDPGLQIILLNSWIIHEHRDVQLGVVSILLQRNPVVQCSAACERNIERERKWPKDRTHGTPLNDFYVHMRLTSIDTQ